MYSKSSDRCLLTLPTVQEILRLDQEKEERPIYRVIHFNCHDFAINFASLLVDRPPVSQLRDLSWYSEHAKDRFCRTHAHYSPRIIGLVLCLSVIQLLAVSLGVGIPGRAGICMGFMATILVVCHVLWVTSKQTTERDRFHWRRVLEERFPLLATVCIDLGKPDDIWDCIGGDGNEIPWGG